MIYKMLKRITLYSKKLKKIQKRKPKTIEKYQKQKHFKNIKTRKNQNHL